jgi:aspartyl-tRNA(Asn)/glutamyl-tRNA(Gln) amidotransferase subunit A
MNSYSEDKSRFASKEISPVNLVEDIYEQIKKCSNLNAFITLCPDSALESAKEAERRFAENNPRELEGMIIAVKDNISTKDIRTTCGSKILENFIPIYDATVIAKLKDAGAIIIGKTNMDEFAMGSSNENSYFGNVLNPVDEKLVPGGSSGGSATALVAGFCHASLGSETGGSVRQPASFVGSFGYKPSYGTVSRYGLVAYGSSFDQIGIFANNSYDMALVLDCISGCDENDSTSDSRKSLSSHNNLSSNINKINESEITIGVAPESVLKHSNFEIIEKYQNSIKKLEDLGYKIKPVEFPLSHVWIAVYYIISTAEASSNLSRFDGIRYGFRAEFDDNEENISDIDLIKASRSQGFGEEVKRRILLGTYVLSAGHQDKFYSQALKARRLIFNNYKRIFSEVDYIFLPTTPTPAFKFKEKENPVAMYMSDFYTASANLAGIPAINIPTHKSKSGLPIGMQLQADNFKDEELVLISEKIYQLLK